MKKTILILSAFAASVMFTACGGGGEKQGEEESKQETTAPKGMVEISLEAYGFPITVPVPDTTMNPLDITEQDWGAVEIRAGKYFQMQVAEGGDLDLKKSDLKEDLLYKAEILEEGPGYVVYKQYIEGSNVEPFYHFYMVKNINGTDYEIQDINTGEAFPEKAVRKMFEAAKAAK